MPFNRNGVPLPREPLPFASFFVKRVARLYATDPRNPAPSSLAVRAVMLANRGKDTGPELLLRRLLRTNGMRGYRLHRRIGGTRPDITFGPERVAVFVNGCYWHRCPTCRYPLPNSHRSFWRTKFLRNRARDAKKSRELASLGWLVMTVWGHELEQRPTLIAKRIAASLIRRSASRLGGVRPTTRSV